VTGGVLDDGKIARHAFEGLGDQIVVLGGLVGDGDAVEGAELPGPHAGAVDHELRLDVALVGGHTRSTAVLRGDARDHNLFNDLHALEPRSFGQGHRAVDGVDAPVLRQIETRLDVIDLGQREELLDLIRADLLDLVAEHPIEGCDPAVLFHAVRIRRQLDEANRLEAGAQPGLLLEAPIEIARVHAHLDRGLRGGTKGGHQARRVPGGAAGQMVALQQDDVRPTQVGQMVSHRRSNNATTHDHDAGFLR